MATVQHANLCPVFDVGQFELDFCKFRFGIGRIGDLASNRLVF